MKVLRSALFATVVIGLLISGMAPRKAGAVITLQRLGTDCATVTTQTRSVSGTNEPTEVYPSGCTTYGWVSEPDDRGGGVIGGQSDYLGGGGGGVHSGSRTVSNQGDKNATQRDASAKTTCDQRSDPVVFSTGNEIEPEVDFGSAGEMGLSLTRTYNHYWNGIGIFGRRWLSDYDYKLLFTTVDPTSTCYTRPGNTPCDPTGKPIWALRPDGRQIKFNYSTTPTPGWYEDKPSPIAKIIKTGSTYTLYSEDHTVEVYGSHGFPSVISNQQGVSWTFSYDTNHYLTRVTQSSGRHVDFGWTNGLLAQITDPAGNVYHYTYATISVSTDSAQSKQSVSPLLRQGGGLDDPPPTPPYPPIQTMVALLTSATQPASLGGAPATVTTYHYEDARFATALTGKSINGSRYSWITYDANAMATEAKLAGNVEDYQFIYTLDVNGAITNTTITNPLAKKTEYDFNASGNQTAVNGFASTHCSASAKALNYDSNGYLYGATDFNGNVTLYNYAANGQLQQEVRGSGTPVEQTTDYLWDPTYNRPTKITVQGDHSTSYSYGADNRLTSVAVKNLSSAVAASQGQVHTTAFTYTTWPNGLLKTEVIDGPLQGSADAITLTYSQAGDLLSNQDALGHTETYGNYSGLGLPGSITGPNGDETDYVYDARGREVDKQTHRNGGSQDTHYEYDGFGRLSRVTQPDGQTHSYQYDVAGRLLSEYQPEPGGTFAQTVYTYNAMSLPTSIKTQRVTVEPPRGTMP